jgi:methyl coenzyme M reductase subunit C
MTLIAHPSCAPQVCAVHDERAIRLARGIDAQHELCDFAPVGARRFGVEKAQVEGRVVEVVSGVVSGDASL